MRLARRLVTTGTARALRVLLLCPVVLSSCNENVMCEPIGNSCASAPLIVRFDGSVANVLDGETDACIDAQCKSVVWSPTHGEHFSAALENGSLSLSQLSNGALELGVSFSPSVEGKARTVGINIIDPNGATVLKLEESLLYERQENDDCGPTCSGQRQIDLRGESDAGAEAASR